MTDEEMAEEYVDALLDKDDAELDKFLDENLGDLQLTKKQAGTLLGIIKGVGINSFLAGLEAKKPKWHDLRENPNDLPKKDERFLTNVSITVMTQKNEFACYYFDDKQWYSETVMINPPIAWCNIPKFEEMNR